MGDKNALEKYDPLRVVAGLAGGNEDVKSAAAENPGTAVAIIASVHTQGGASLPVLARALDNVLGLIQDRKARGLLDKHVTPEVQAEMVVVHGDLPSVIIQVADPEVIVAALESDAAQTQEVDRGHLVSVSFLIRAWARNAKDRNDWLALLEAEIGELILEDLLIAAVYFDAREDVDEISPDMWEEVGLDPMDAYERLDELLETDELPRFSELDVAVAGKRLRALRESFQQETSVEALRKLVEDIEI
ncbi:hypothetical protein EPN81_00155 [Patescibacteria group bacterium]|nr:MAG: hypothetical protein EPN81_00155 [Patescibacteria group bacterium]